MTTVEEAGTEVATGGTGPTWQPNPLSIHHSLANYINERSDVEITPGQCQALLKFHGVWQKSPERDAEREQEKVEKAAAAAAKKAQRDALAADKKAATAREKAAKDAAAAAKKAAANDDDSDLDAVDTDPDDDSEATPAPVRRKPRVKGTGSEF